MTALPFADNLRLTKPVTREVAVLVAKVAIIVFTIEALIMLTLFSDGDVNSKVIADGLLDASMLTLLSSPLIYLWVARPFAEAARTARAELIDQLAQSRSLLEQNEKLRATLQIMSQNAADINERILQKIGADLHDGAAQLLSFSLLKLDRLTPGLQRAGDVKGLAELEKMRGVITDTLREVRGISTGLSLPELDAVSIEETVRLVVRRHEELTGTKVTISTRDIPATAAISQKACIYRFVQEALSNAYKHSQAKSTRVDVAGGPPLTITVSDNGKGFDPTGQARSGLGLTGMRARIQAIGGQLTIASAPSQGTTVTAVFSTQPWDVRP